MSASAGRRLREIIAKRLAAVKDRAGSSTAVMLRPRLPKRLKLQVQAAKKIFSRNVSAEYLRYMTNRVIKRDL